MADITLRRMTLADAPAVHAIEAATFAIPWSLQSFEEEMTRNLLTAGLMQYAANLGVTYMTLEVRRSNETAQSLYRSLGFIQVGVRKKYYEDNGEDALFMVCDHMPPAQEDFEEPETVRE